MWKKIKNFTLDVLFPKFCLNCGAEGTLLCEDCEALLEITGFHQKHSTQSLKDLYFPVNYKNPLIKNLIHIFKYEPLVKELSKPLSSLIISHFLLMDNKPEFSDRLIIPLPLGKRRLKWRGFNQAEEIGKFLAEFWKIPLVSNCLIKIKETVPQIELEEEARKENIKGVFLAANKELIKNRKIILIDDVYTTGSTMEECARVLRYAGAKEIVGIVIARG